MQLFGSFYKSNNCILLLGNAEVSYPAISKGQDLAVHISVS